MKRFNKNIMIALAGFFVVGIGLALSGTAYAATAPSLGAAATYGAIGSTFTNTVAGTTINGDLGYITAPATAPTVNGTTYVNSGTYGQAGIDQATALANLNGQACTSIGTNVDLNAIVIGSNPAGTFPPGCYSSSGTMNIVTGTTVTLSGAGVYIFRAGGALTTQANSFVVLANGANAANVFWTPVGATTLGANATLLATPTFVGNIFRGTAAGLSVTLGHNATLLGRVLAYGSTVTTDTNTITVPTTLNVIKLVVNSSHTAVPGDFNVHVKDSLNAEVANSPLAGVAAPGTAYTLASSTYTVSEDANALYTQTFTGDCNASGVVTLATGDNKTCTVVNTDIPVVVPASVVAGTPVSLAAIVAPVIGLTKVPSPLALFATSGPVTYNYTVWNVGNQQQMINVKLVDNKCSPITYLSGDTNNDSKLDPGEKWKYSCTTTLATTTTNTAIVTGVSDDPYHQTAIATAIATVVVNPPVAIPAVVTPPLISIVKVPSRLTPFTFGGGNVTYSYTVTNPGVVAMSNVSLKDDKCGPVSGPFGDANNNSWLEPSETWSYACSANVPVSTRNVATVQGTANGLVALGYAFSNVLVAAPGLPNTGYGDTATSTKGLKRAAAIAAFHRSLGIGSRGKDVEVLQTLLEEKGLLTMPEGVAKGYFGTLTREAVNTYQESVKLPKAGVFGPRTKAKITSELSE